jgi:hypothetical protein
MLAENKNDWRPTMKTDNMWFGTVMVLSVVLFIVSCAGLEPSEKEAIAEQAHKTVNSIMDNIPGGGVISDISTLAVMVWLGIFGKKKVTQKVNEIKDSGKGEFFAKKKKPS